jgi:hypothetical protein
MEWYNAAFLPAPDTRIAGSVEVAWIEDGGALRIKPGARAIRGRWEKSGDQGETWEHDFNIDSLRE